MEAALGMKHDSQGTSIGKRAVVRYADDFVVFCESQEDALVVRDRILPEWLARRGLSVTGEDADCPPERRVRLPGLQRQTLPAPADLTVGVQAAYQTEQESGTRQSG